MAKVLLFQCGNEAEIRQALTAMRITAISVPADCFHLTLGELEKERFSASGSAEREKVLAGQGMTAESLMVMCDVTEKQMNRLLMEFRRREIRIDYKAVLTPTNRDWPVRRMYLEMARERAMYASYYASQKPSEGR